MGPTKKRREMKSFQFTWGIKCGDGMVLDYMGLDTKFKWVPRIYGEISQDLYWKQNFISIKVSGGRGTGDTDYQHQLVAVWDNWPHVTGESQQFVQTLLDIELGQTLGCKTSVLQPRVCPRKFLGSPHTAP